MFKNSDSSIKIIPTAAPIYSLGFCALHTPILSSVTIRGIDGLSAHTLSLSVYGLSKSGFFLERTALPTDELFFREAEGDIHIDLRAVTLAIRRDFFRNLKAAVTGKLCIEVVADGVRYAGDAPITLLPARVYPVSAAPSYFAVCLTPCRPEITRIVENVATRSLEGLYAAVKRQSVIYSVRECDFFRRDTDFSDAEMLFNGRARMATPLEMAQLFCAAALRLGLAPIVAAVRGTKAPRLFCGVAENGAFDDACGMTTQRFLSALMRRRAFVFDVSCLFTGHSVELEDACHKALEELCDTPPTFLVDINRVLRDGADLFGLYSEDAEREKALVTSLRTAAPEAKISLAAFAEALTHADRNPLLRYSPSDCGGIPVDLSDFSSLPRLAAEKGEYVLNGTTENADFQKIASHLDPFGFRTETAANGATLAEKAELERHLAAYRAYLAEAEPKRLLGVPVGLAVQLAEIERLFCQIDSEEKELYLACGFLRLGGSLAPTSLYPVTLTQNGSRPTLRFTAAVPYVNRLLCETVKKRGGKAFFDRYGLPGNDFADITRCFEHVSKEIGVPFLKCAVLAAFPYRNAVTAFDLADKSEKLSNDKTAALLLSDKKGDGSHPDGRAYFERIRTLEETLPACCDGDALFACAVSRDEDLLVSCRNGDIALQSALSAAQNNMRLGFSTLLCAQRQDSLSAVADAFRALDFTEPLLLLHDGCDPKAALREKLEALSEVSLPDERSDAAFSEIESEYAALREHLYAYRDGKTKRYDFGFSFYDAACAFTAAGNRLTEEERQISVEPETLFYPDMGKASAENLFDAQRSLCRAARALFPNEPYNRHPFRYVKTVEKELKIPTAAHLIEKCRLGFEEFLPIGRRILDKMPCEQTDITSLPSLYALLSLAVLLLNNRDADLTGELLSGDVYTISERIVSLAATANEINDEKRALGDFDPKIFDADADRLFDGWTSEQGMSRADITKEINDYRREEPDLLHPTFKKSIPDVLESLCRIASLRRQFDEDAVSVLALFPKTQNGEKTDFSALSALTDSAKKIDILLKKIYGTDTDSRKAAAKRLPALLTLFETDTELPADIMKAAALFDRMFSDDSCFLSLASYLGADLYVPSFPDGILSDNGFFALLCDLREHIDLLPLVTEYNRCCERCRSLGLGVFVDYFATHAATPSADAIFLRSQLHLMMKQMALSDKKLLAYPDYERDVKRFRTLHRLRIEQNRDDLKRLYFRRCSSYIRENPEKASAFAEDLERQNVAAEDILLRHGDILRTLFPVVAAQPSYCGFVSGFETAAVLDADTLTPEKAIVCFPCAKHKLFLSDSERAAANSVGSLLRRNGITVLDSTVLRAQSAPALTHFLSPVSGYDRENETNLPEAQTVGLSLLKAAEQNPSLRAAIIAPNQAQVGVLRGILRILCEKSPVIARATAERRIDIADRDGLLPRRYDLVLSEAVYTADCDKALTNGASDRLLSALKNADTEKAILVSVLYPHRYPDVAGARAALDTEALTTAAREGIDALYPPSHFTDDAQHSAVEFCRLLSREKIPCALTKNGCGVLAGTKENRTVCFFDRKTAAVFDYGRETDETVRYLDSAELYLNPQKLLDGLYPSQQKGDIL